MDGREPPRDAGGAEELSSALCELFQASGLTLATMESCTGGLLASTITDIPGSGYLLGGIVAYDTPQKARWGVPEGVLAEYGPISAETAVEMARAARARVGADVGAAVTGVAGPDSQDGSDPGDIFVAVADGDRVEWRRLACEGDRRAVKRAAVNAALALLLTTSELRDGDSRGDTTLAVVGGRN